MNTIEAENDSDSLLWNRRRSEINLENMVPDGNKKNDDKEKQQTAKRK